MKKKIIAMLLTMGMILALCSCGNAASQNQTQTPGKTQEVDPSVFSDWTVQKDDIAGTAEYSVKSDSSSTYLLESKFEWKVADGENKTSNVYYMPFYVNDKNQELFISAKVIYDEGAQIPYKMLIGFLYFIGEDAPEYTCEFIVKTENQRFSLDNYWVQHGHLSHNGWAPHREYYKVDKNTTFIEEASSGGIYLNHVTESLFKDIKDNPDKDVVVRFGLSNTNVTPTDITKTIDVTLSQDQKDFLIEMYNCYISAHLNEQE